MLLLVASALVTTGLAAPHASTSAQGLLAAVEAHLSHEGPDACLTPLVNELKLRAAELTPAERAWATSALMPWKADLLDPVAPVRAAGEAPPAPFASEPCFSLGENRITSAHFAVEWDDGTISEATADNFLESLEEGYTVEVDELGWKAPLQNDDYLVLAYVQEGSYQGAYTTIESCGRGVVPYIVAYAGSFSNRSWAETMAVHEFNHALQFGYGYSWEFWWWEATATYIEGVVYPTSNWWASYVSGYSNNPHIAFNASDQNDRDIFWHMYGMGLWGAYLDEYVGGPDTVLATWESASGGTYSYGMRAAFADLGLDFDAAYTDFIVRNTVMDYADQGAIPGVDERASIDELPASDEIDGSTRPQGYGQTYIRFEKEAGEGDLVVSFEGEADVPWSVQLVEVTRDEIVRVVAAEIVDGVGTVTLEGFGAEDVVFVASPLKDGDTKYGFTWSAELVEPAVEEVVVDEVGDEEAPGGCGCASGGGPGAGIGLLLGLAAIARRRQGAPTR
ncbi:MAG: MYXO-CTERM sorting domain-containing protein [Pseudomonadota bacterium]|nr:MYXO-CTERM sorting domain-containing protein [Pseudomonadota bacterium]